jgi:acyl carrier protein
MDNELIAQEVVQILAEMTGEFPETIDLDAPLADLFPETSVDMEGFLDLVFYLETEFGIYLPDEQLDAMQYGTVADAIAIVIQTIE